MLISAILSHDYYIKANVLKIDTQSISMKSKAQLKYKVRLNFKGQLKSICSKNL